MKKIIYIFSTIFIIICVALSITSLTSGTSSEVSLTTLKLGIPISHTRFYAQNIQEAFEKVESGNFDEKDFSSPAWEYAYANLDPTTDNKELIHLPNGISFGKGIKNSEENTAKIMPLLPTQLLQELSGIELSRYEEFALHTPGNKGLKYSNSQGVSVGRIQTGWNAIFEGNNFVKLVNLDHGVKSIVIDTVNTNTEISSKISNISEAAKDKNGVYTIEYGEKVKYQIRVSKNLLSNGLSLNVDIPLNVVIDEISLPSTQVLKDTAIDTTGLQNANYTIPDKLAKSSQYLNKLFDSSSQSYYRIDLPATSEDLTFTITAHIEPVVQVIQNVLVDQTSGPQGVFIEKKAFVSSQGVLKNFRLTISGEAQSGEQITNQTPAIGSSGINFLTVNTKTKKATTGSRYVLGKKVGNDNYYWVGKDQWIKMQGDAYLSYPGIRQLSGNQIYVIGAEDSEAIYGSNSFWSQTLKDEELSQSCIRILGLKQGSNYFFMEVQTSNGNAENKNVSTFKVYRDGNKTSLGNAGNQDFELNTYLPDYRAGSNEYNLLSESRVTPSIGGERVLLIGQIILTVVLMLGAVLLILKRF
ncbi:MAG: hypothetical protein LBI13_02420 [Streptococcaceae bacterium]|jgi:hypothetical protein|nr:hypothetical protein [Streptococcaceae bacterium]